MCSLNVQNQCELPLPAYQSNRRRQGQKTWPEPDQQIVHISNGRSAFNDRQHADQIEVMSSSYVEAPWIEVEAKLKEEAIRALRSWP